jgi:hypothetical protein
MIFLVSVASDVFQRMMNMRALYRRLGIETSIHREVPALLGDVRTSFGGRLVLLDWSERRVLADLPVAGATGFEIHDDSIIVGSWTQHHVYKLRGRDQEVAVTHPWFNYIHSVDVTPRGTYLLACAGSDLIIEVTESGAVEWEWFGPEHGFALRPDGTPTFFDRNADYRNMRRSTSEQAMHVNSAISGPGDTVLATLFHQGQLISIDRKSGQATVILAGLTKPHGIHRRDGGFLLSDTLGHRVVFLNDELKVSNEIAYGTQWLQDTIPAGAGTYLTLENVHIDQLPEPGLTNRIVEIDGAGKPVRGVDVGPNHRLFTVRKVDEALGHALARAWSTTGELDDWRWS